MTIGGMGLDDWLNTPDERGGRGSFLSWKTSISDDKGEATIWLHPGTKIEPFHAHPWFDVIEGKVEGSDEKELIVITPRFICHESKTILDRQHFRDKDTGERDYPPILCPMCLMVEWLYQQVEVEGTIAPETEVFKFEGDDPEKVVILHAGGITGYYGKKDLDKRAIQQMRKAGIRRDEAWREKLHAKQQTLFYVIDNGNPVEVVKAIEGKELTQKLKKCIKDQIEARGEKGHPFRHPYPFKLKFDKTKDIGKMYDVVALTEEKPSDEVFRQLNAEVEVESFEPGDCVSLRAAFEQFAQIDMPFDEFFAPAKKAGLMKSKAGKTTDKKRTPDVRGDDEGDEEEDETSDDSPDDDIHCDYCGGVMGDEDIVCDGCGTTYDENTKKLDGLPCLSERCKGKKVAVPLVIKDGKYDAEHICETCGTIHLLAFETVSDEHGSFDKPNWSVKPEESKPESVPVQRRRRSASAARPEPAKEPEPKTDAKKPAASAAKSSNGRRRGNGKTKVEEPTDTTDSGAIDRILKGEKIPF